MTPYSIVVPTVGRVTLTALLESLARSDGPRPSHIVVVDDRPAGGGPLPLPASGWSTSLVQVRHSGGRGPAAARNVGWRACDTEWIAFLDDDVLVGPTWPADLAADLDPLGPGVAASQARIEVPLPADRRPTDWEKGTAGLASATWITADMAYRRAALLEAGGFDERFPRAFREDADLALRVLDRGWTIADGARTTTHPVRPARWRASLDQQRGNADDVLMARLHGRDWYARAHAARGRRPVHLATSAALGAAILATVLGRRGPAVAAGCAWAVSTTEFAWTRIAPGPRDRAEIGRMLATSALIPPAASWHWAHGVLRHRSARPWPAAVAGTSVMRSIRDQWAGVSGHSPRIGPLSEGRPPIEAVLFDRDGTLVHDVPYNGRAELVRPVDGARAAVDRLRAAGIRIGVITNQSGIARGLIDPDDVRAVNARVDDLLGPFDTWQVCPHDDRDGCACRKPQPGMVLAAAGALGVPVERCVVVGDTAADIGAGAAAGARAILVPNAVTRSEEVGEAVWTAPDLTSAVDAMLAEAAGIATAPPGEHRRSRSLVRR